MAQTSVKVRNQKRKDTDKNSPYCFTSDLQFQFCLYHESLVVVTEYESISLGVISKNLEKMYFIFRHLFEDNSSVFFSLLRLKGMMFSNKC